MPDLNNKPDGDGIEDLSPTQRKETEEIIKEIADNAQESKPEEKLEVKEEKPKPEPKPEDKPKDGDKKTEEKSRKGVKMMPEWVHKTAEDNWQKQREKLEGDLAEARKASVKSEENKDKGKDETDIDLRKKTDAIAQKYGTDPDEEYERAITARSTTQQSPKVEIPKEITEGIENVKKWTQENQLKAEEEHFNSDFNDRLLPLIKAEYGDDVPASTIEEIKDKVKEKAYSDDFAKVPLTTIYKGIDDFRGLIPAKQRGSEKGRGGYHQTVIADKSDELDLSQEQNDDVVAKMTPDQFDTYSNNMAKREKK